ncbi:Glycosyltransferase involved in cell wall bisynthesis [Candidatus Pantoea symbiotica]|jgi:glycosyltransferase involved in cell wall biosynthesis|uniref:Glycosyltransferase involved in cell wall bisynthesis n=1 Tax=Candidatus Pantoea symbiotica TaxID=1884370 RepID=A0A1I3QZT6_9GAMM|nr:MULTISPECIES: glycosyltransferase family 2 protein [Pantoea]KAJ9433440.1 glycosyltransferase family 2 protein [Pantoea sp. YR343]MRT22908.1 glycosyltransferase [Enterobacteriaceae bacterium RIT697]SFJ39608.1 Glycosyltransferase involved in cell wall bisynthesis [Pantoea symbiotica]SFU35674.1 Glycosyltransferase involved in cell wall bisynthesis [Pantoea sp. YR525]
MKISLVVPVFNEEDAIPVFYRTVKEKLSSYNLEIIFINDGSTDSTEQIVKSIQNNDESVLVINFIRNFGKEAALLAGLEHSSGDAVIPVDVDLQDPIEVIPLLINKWQEGWPIVLAKRNDRRSDSRFKRKTAAWFYKLHNKISSPKLEENVGDFRLLSRATVENIKQLQERNLFMKGLLSWVEGDSAIVEYSRPARIAGEAKFNGWRLWNLALEGLTSFSTFPLRVWTYIGFFVAFLSFVYGAWMIIDKIIWGNPVAGYPSLLVSILFLGGIQLIGIGVLGEYIGRIYIETKHRPRYIKKESND